MKRVFPASPRFYFFVPRTVLCVAFAFGMGRCVVPLEIKHAPVCRFQMKDHTAVEARDILDLSRFLLIQTTDRRLLALQAGELQSIELIQRPATGALYLFEGPIAANRASSPRGKPPTPALSSRPATSSSGSRSEPPVLEALTRSVDVIEFDLRPFRDVASTLDDGTKVRLIEVERAHDCPSWPLRRGPAEETL
jgi:hypothetical protein